MQILLVEDDKAIREVMQYYFCDESKGRHCESASTLAEAIAMVTRIRFDVIFLDLLLQDGIGTALIDYVRQLHPNNTPGICIVSAMYGAEKIALDKKVPFCSKPFSLETIEDLILTRYCH